MKKYTTVTKAELFRENEELTQRSNRQIVTIQRKNEIIAELEARIARESKTHADELARISKQRDEFEARLHIANAKRADLQESCDHLRKTAEIAQAAIATATQYADEPPSSLLADRLDTANTHIDELERVITYLKDIIQERNRAWINLQIVNQLNKDTAQKLREQIEHNER